ncbi:MAG: CorA family divalent cation transporter [Alphaproteobacteria bacterium]
MTTAVAFDFARKTMRTLPLDGVAGAIAEGQFCWIDFDELEAAAAALPTFGANLDVTTRIGLDQQHCQARYSETCVYAVLLEAQARDGELQLTPVHVSLARGLIATVHARPSPLIADMRAACERDFHEMAESGGFLLYELADHLTIGYRETLSALTASVDGIQRRLLGDVGDEILMDVSSLTRALLEYRNAVVAARETMDELATRRSAFVPASTQPFLDRQTVPLDRLANDASIERTVLSEVLNLYMGIVSHRTNKVVNRLTVVSMILLPLNFIAAIYGMNFEVMPELHWRFGYAGFWGISLVLVATLLVLFRRRRWI